MEGKENDNNEIIGNNDNEINVFINNNDKFDLLKYLIYIYFFYLSK